MTQHEAVERMRELFPGLTVNIKFTEWFQVYEDGETATRFDWAAYVALPVNELFTGETLAEVMKQAEAFAAERAQDIEAKRLAAESDAALAARQARLPDTDTESLFQRRGIL